MLNRVSLIKRFIIDLVVKPANHPRKVKMVNSLRKLSAKDYE